MSLLMDALKKAEQAKRLASESASSGGAQEVPRTSIPPLEDLPFQPPLPPPSPLPNLTEHIDSVDADLAAVSISAPDRRRTPYTLTKPPDTNQNEADERTAARNVFTAKQMPPKSRPGFWLLIGLTVLLSLGLVGYFWWQLQAVSGGSLSRTASSINAPQPQAAVTPATPVVTQPPAEAQNALLEPIVPEIAPVFEPPSVTASPVAQKPRPKPLNEPAIRSPRQVTTPIQAEVDAPVKLSRNQPKPNLLLEHAYDALLAGKLSEAQRGYEQVLRSDAKNTDALNGLATIAASQGQADRAEAYYLRALESDPNDATAQAGLINIRGQDDTGLSESRLKTALSSQPDSPVLHFALGNFYARQQRWSEAQQAYFKAYSAEPDNADFIFNLAVSLDHLHQNKLAAQYYQMALSAAAAYNSSRNLAFDKSQVNTRILELQP